MSSIDGRLARVHIEGRAQRAAEGSTMTDKWFACLMILNAMVAIVANLANVL